MQPSDSPLVQLFPYIAAVLILLAKKMNLLGKATAYMTENDVAKIAAPQPQANGLALATLTLTGVDRQLGMIDTTVRMLREDFRRHIEEYEQQQVTLLQRIDRMEKRLPPMEQPGAEVKPA